MIKNGDTIGVVYPDSWFVVGREKENLSYDIEIFPNPSFGKITIRIKNSPQTSATLLDLQWKEILNHEFSGSETEINISEIPTGIYFLRVKTDAGTAVKKIVISGK